MARIAEASRPRSFLRPQLRRLGIGIAAAACVMLAVVGYYRLQPSTVPDIEMFIRQADTPVFTQKEVQLVLSSRKPSCSKPKIDNPLRFDRHPDQQRRKNHSQKEAATFNQLVVPYGKQTTLTLADGTRVWINAGSRLVYPVVFEKQKREIYVEGEIYMEVAHDAERPFSVHTGKMDVCVLGTKFYISSYGRDRTQEVVLLSGSVSVAPAGRSDRGIRIVPGQQAILGTSESLEVREVEAESYISWIHGYLPFDNDPLSNILERLSRYYNCRIECTPEAEALTLSGKLELKDDPAEVLKILSATAPINLQITGSGNFRIDYNPTTNNPN